ncbi:MAG TPA: sugar phosphate nucleotidyltransferase [Gammaproteobacteria bacterium]|nr:sugar phosphate nucleotidyltransferase [Gammaproteobacteria bacterium]
MSTTSRAPLRERFAVVMAGGRGERFWPLSREKTPKQLLKLLGERSFLQQAVDRVLPCVPAEHVFVITNEAQAGDVRAQLPFLPSGNIVAEPMGRDTCAAVALGAALVGARSASGVMAVLPADHVIPDADAFVSVLRDAFAVAETTEAFVTIGIEPTEPATGYGYIRLGDRLEDPALGSLATGFRRAERFVEKPPYETAVEYLASGRYRWNAGMFVWTFEALARGLRAHVPAMHEACRRWTGVATDSGAFASLLARDYPAVEKISIDYALMERADNVVVADAGFAWDDVGSWSALARHLEPDADGNCAVADFVHVDSAGNLIYDARTVRTPIALVGLRDVIVVQTDDAVLVAQKHEAQKVKDLVRRLAADERLKKLV